MRTLRNDDPDTDAAAGSREPIHPWLHAIRPRTLPAGAVPVVVGTALALGDGAFHAYAAFAALAVALLLQVATNLANDYWDHKKGADTPDRQGRPRVVASGLIPGHRVRNTALALFFMAGLVGLSLVPRAGWEIVLVGAVCMIAGLLYTAGPRPLGYNGLGDLSVFLFFGPVAVVGTYYVQALQINAWVLLASIPVGALATAILVVNNLRDLHTDKAAGKNTLAVLIGPTGSRTEYLALVALAYAVPVVLAIQAQAWGLLLPLASLPLAVLLVVRLWRIQEPGGMNLLLERTAMLLLLFGVLFAASFVIPVAGVAP